MHEENLNIEGIDSDSKPIGIALAVGLVALLGATLVASGFEGFECVRNLGSGVACNNGFVGFSFHNQLPTDTKSIAIWLQGLDIFSGRAGIAWMPGEGLKVWSSFFTDGLLKEHFFNIP